MNLRIVAQEWVEEAGEPDRIDAVLSDGSYLRFRHDPGWRFPTCHRVEDGRELGANPLLIGLPVDVLQDMEEALSTRFSEDRQ